MIFKLFNAVSKTVFWSKNRKFIPVFSPYQKNTLPWNVSPSQQQSKQISYRSPSIYRITWRKIFLLLYLFDRVECRVKWPIPVSDLIFYEFIQSSLYNNLCGTFVAPLKGIPSRIPSGGFRTSVLSSNVSRPTPTRPLSGRKDCAIKLLDITEQPIGYAQAKKRKRMLGE